jgi:hypothetical protein
VEWAGELGLTNLLGSAETIRARVAHTKNDFTLQDVRAEVSNTRTLTLTLTLCAHSPSPTPIAGRL